ncbi:hypothetical protein ACM64Y_12990 [Novispirillum sp. DQ9]|uniref:hypothetical protein n=1 Tax=Novispirillum sp. DQ9 TaxID=3398612 RepID=UPI003C7DC076
MHIQSLPQTQRHALLLDRAAHLLEHARDTSALSWAVQNNLAVWLALRAAAEQRTLEEIDPARVRELAEHVISTTLKCGRIAPHDGQIEAFITMNRTLARTLVGAPDDQTRH